MRPDATIVIPVWNQWAETEACLASLRPTMAAGDEVIVVDNGSSDETATRLGEHPWVQVITNPTNRGFAAACNQGAAAAGRDVIVFLNNDTVVPPGWLERLIEPFGDPNVGATGPRSNFVAGPQMVPEVGYDIDDRAGYHAWVAAWSARHDRRLDLAHTLIGFCLAVSRTAFEEVGRFDEGFGIGGFEDTDLTLKMFDRGWILLIVHDAFVHHVGHRTFDGNGVDWAAVQLANQPRFESNMLGDEVLLSAALIVRDEEADLGRCLDSLSGVVDEVVVYDTGSTDRTVEIARDRGAIVVDGFWDDDFSRARNAAMSHCRGRWVLSIDADEVFQTDAAYLRALLASPIPFDAMALDITNLEGTTDAFREGMSHYMFRLARRTRCRWIHALHETLTHVEGQRPLRQGRPDKTRILHYGYLMDVAAQRSKGDRNIRVALADVEATTDATPDERCVKLVNLGRSYVFMNRIEEAAACYERARELAESKDCRRVTLRCGVEALITLGRYDQARDWLAALEDLVGPDSMPLRFLRSQLLRSTGDNAGALAELETLDYLHTEEGIRYGDEYVENAKATALAEAGRWEEALDQLLRAGLRTRVFNWAAILRAVHHAGGSPAMVAALVEPAHVEQFAAALRGVPVETAGPALEAVWERLGEIPPVLAAAAHLAPTLPLEQALTWSGRFREAGLPTFCPLRMTVDDTLRDPVARLRAAAILTTAFDEPTPDDLVRVMAADLEPGALHAVIAFADQVAPSMIPVLIAGAACSRERALMVSAVLDNLGIDQAAAVVLQSVFGHTDRAQAARELATAG